MTVKHFLFLFSGLLVLACSHDPEIQNPLNDLPTGKLSIESVATTPSVFNADTISSNLFSIRTVFQIVVDRDMDVQLTAGLINSNGYTTHENQTIRVFKATREYFVSFNIPVDPFQLENPLLHLEAGEAGKNPDVRISPFIPAVSAPPTSVIDSILFEPAAGASIGTSFSMTVYASDKNGTGNLSRVTVLGKRPDGTNQNSFDVPQISPGIFQISLPVPSSAQIGTYTWKFLVLNKSGIPGIPVVRQYKVLP